MARAKTRALRRPLAVLPYLLVLLAGAALPARAQVYVWSGATCPGTGTSWATAYCKLQTALAATSSGEIWVAAGTYYPDEGTGQTNNARASTFTLKDDVALYGGFDGTETLRSERDWTANPTLLSGDVNGNGTLTGNSYHVVSATEGQGATAVLDGFTITGGFANSATALRDVGGGIFCNNASSPTLANLSVTGNTASYGGGGQANLDGSSPALTGVAFTSNIASTYGAGMYNESESSPTLTDVTFSGNKGSSFGGGLTNLYDSSPVLTDVTFTANGAMNGGGMYSFDGSSPTLANVRFAGNEASFGGAVGQDDGVATFTNVVFSGNYASENGGALITAYATLLMSGVTCAGNAARSDGCFSMSNAEVQITNSIFWGNRATEAFLHTADQEIYAVACTLSIRHTLIQDAYEGGSWASVLGVDAGGNLDADPLFMGFAAAADNAGTTAGDFRVQPGSPAIDAGINAAVPGGVTTDLAGSVRFYDDPATTDTGAGSAPLVDLGAYEYDGYSAPRTYVRASAACPGDGAGWDTAYCDLQTALAATAGGQVWVAAGTYYPDEGTGQTGDAAASTFQLVNGVKVYGGFAGTETLLGQRDPEANVTILSGEIQQDGDAANNAYHVVSASTGQTAATVLDGFTITAGNADAANVWPDNVGGGLYVDAAHPTLANLVVTANTAGFGGGMYLVNNSAAALTDVVFDANTADEGGGLAVAFGSSPTLTDVTFSANTSVIWGGGMINYATHPTLTRVTFTGNHTDGSGGGLQNEDSSSPTLIDVTFDGNTADGPGGGMSDRGGSGTLTGVTFTNNTAGEGGGGLSVVFDYSAPTLTNVRFAGNEAMFGGALENQEATLVLNNVLLSGNRAAVTGGAVDNWGGSLTLAGVTCAGNVVAGGAGACVYAFAGADVQVVNSIVWGNEAGFNDADHTAGGDEIYLDGSTATFRYSHVQDAFAGGSWDAGLGTDGGNNADDDPLFVSFAAATSSGPTTAGEFQVLAGSPVIDAGDNTAVPGSLTADLAGNLRFADDPGTLDTGSGASPIVDRGVYEFGADPLPVELATFTAVADGAAVVLQWTTASETNNAGFEVERMEAGGRGAAQTWQRLGFVAGAGTTSEAQAYRYRAEGLEPGRHTFRLKQVDYDGAFEYSAEVEVELAVPRLLALEPGYPNPFASTSRLAFTVPQTGPATVRLYDLLGRQVRVLYDGVAEAGQRYDLTLDAAGLAAGSYVCRLQSATGQRTQMLVVAR